MQTIPFERASNGGGAVDEAAREIGAVLDRGGLVCLPCGGSYRILADLTNPAAVTRLLQAKRRTSKKPALVFVADETMLATVSGAVPDDVGRLARRYWPGPLTILLAPNAELPRKVTKALAAYDGHFGVRVPQDDLARRVVQSLGRPILVSSANRQKKQGAASPAQVRKNFVHAIDLFIDGGDLPTGPRSTVVSLGPDGPRVVREGAIPAADLAGA